MSLYDKKLNDWNTGVDNDVVGFIDDQDAIDKLLVNTDFDAIDIADLGPQTNKFTQVDDVQPFECANDKNSVLAAIVEEFPSLVVEPVALIDEHDRDVDIDVTDKQHLITESDPVSNKEAVQCLTKEPESSDLDKVTEFGCQVIINTAHEAVQGHTQACQADPVTPILEDGLESTDALETLTSLVQNHAKVEKIVVSGDFVVNQFIQKSTDQPFKKSEQGITAANTNVTQQPKKQSLEAQQCATEVTMSLKDWQAFKDEQLKISNQYQQRLVKLEKKLVKIAFFNHVALIFAGLALMAAASCYLK